jgi:hypothetical protein
MVAGEVTAGRDLHHAAGTGVSLRLRLFSKARSVKPRYNFRDRGGVRVRYVALVFQPPMATTVSGVNACVKS